MVNVTSIIVAVIIFLVLLAIGLTLLAGSVPAINDAVELFKNFVSGG